MTPELDLIAHDSAISRAQAWDDALERQVQFVAQDVLAGQDPADELIDQLCMMLADRKVAAIRALCCGDDSALEQIRARSLELWSDIVSEEAVERLGDNHA